MDAPAAPEPVTPHAPRDVGLAVLRLRWTDAVFLHWEIDPAAARALLPAGTRVDLFQGRTFVGMVGITMRVAGPAGPALPWAGTFPQVNVRLYTVDVAGRRGVAFRSLDSPRLLPTAAGRAAWGLPYRWVRGTGSRDGDVVSYALRRRSVGAAATRFRVRVGEPVGPSPLEHWLTARWALHWAAWRRTWWVPLGHEPWPLHRAQLLDSDDELVVAAGLPAPGAPASVLYSPGMRAVVGAPRPVARVRSSGPAR